MATPQDLPEIAHVQTNHVINEGSHPSAEERSHEINIGHNVERQATELLRYGGGARYRVVSVRDGRRDSKVGRWWKRQVSATVEHEGCRDHFALERTFLGYLRTSLALANLGVIVAQLFRLERSLNPSAKIGYSIISVPLASVCVVAGMLMALIGGFRFWKQQNAILRGKTYAGGWDVNIIGGAVLIITLTIFVLLIVIDTEKVFESQ